MESPQKDRSKGAHDSGHKTKMVKSMDNYKID